MSGEYVRLCDRAREVGLHVELVAGKILRRAPGSGSVVEYRSIVEMRVAHDSGNVLAREKMLGLGDRDGAAARLRERIRVLRG